MRKLILISALLLASASAQAGESRGLVLAATDTPAVTTADALPQPLPPVAKTEAKTEAKAEAKTEARTEAKTEARIDAPRRQASEPSAAAFRAAKLRAQTRRYGSDEAKARRIAARYGISW
jgi:hypothetical protein